MTPFLILLAVVIAAIVIGWLIGSGLYYQAAFVVAGVGICAVTFVQYSKRKE